MLFSGTTAGQDTQAGSMYEPPASMGVISCIHHLIVLQMIAAVSCARMSGLVNILTNSPCRRAPFLREVSRHDAVISSFLLPGGQSDRSLSVSPCRAITIIFRMSAIRWRIGRSLPSFKERRFFVSTSSVNRIPWYASPICPDIVRSSVRDFI